MPELEHYRGKDLLGVDELAQVATALIVRYSSVPSRGNVRLRITPRIVRHYLNEDLLGEPTGQLGTATLFNYGNLLRLLAVKKLLVDNWSVLKIRELIRRWDITSLESLIRGDRRDTRRIPKREAIMAVPPRMYDGGRNKEAESNERSGLTAVSSREQGKPTNAAQTNSDWVELAPGLELRIRRGFRPPVNAFDKRRLRNRVDALVFGEEGAGDVSSKPE